MLSSLMDYDIRDYSGLGIIPESGLWSCSIIPGYDKTVILLEGVTSIAHDPLYKLGLPCKYSTVRYL